LGVGDRDVGEGDILRINARRSVHVNAATAATTVHIIGADASSNHIEALNASANEIIALDALPGAYSQRPGGEIEHLRHVSCVFVGIVLFEVVVLVAVVAAPE
jgi:hypothetical protein